MASVIDSHPQREKIIEALLSGQSLRKVAKMAGITHTAVNLYKRSVLLPSIAMSRKALEAQGLQTPEPQGRQLAPEIAVETTKAIAATKPVIQKLLRRAERREELLEAAAKAKDYKGFAALDTCEHRDIRLEAELTGLLQSPGTGNSVEITLTLSPMAAVPQTVSNTPLQQPSGVAFRALEPGDQDDSISNSVEKDKS